MSICSGIEQHARGDGGIFHLTHRCHNRAFLRTFCSRSRRLPCEIAAIRVTVRCPRPGLLLDLLVDATERLEVSGFMRQVADEFARAYNRRKHRNSAFWGDNYQATLVEGGQYLWECLCQDRAPTSVNEHSNWQNHGWQNDHRMRRFIN